MSWHPGDVPPEGRGHGALAVCLTPDGRVVLVSEGTDWSFPGGRPEPGEDWREVMEREVREEACSTVLDASLLGFSRGECLSGPERGLVLVRSAWRASVALGTWEPAHEIVERRLVPTEDVLSTLTHHQSPEWIAREILAAACA